MVAGMVSSDSAALVRVITELERRVKALERAPYLRNASIEAGYIEVNDADGTLRQVVGAQPDGTYTVTDVNGPPPPVPTPAGVFEAPSGLRIYWDGTFAAAAVAPLDFRRITVHAVPALQFNPDTFSPLDQTLIVGTIEHATGGEVSVTLTSNTEYVVLLVAWNLSGKFSVPSTPALGTPLAVQAPDGLPPAVSPTPVVAPGIGALHVSWTPVTNNDPVTYEVHVNNGPGDFTPSAATLVDTTQGATTTVRQLTDGTRITPGEVVRRNLFAPYVDTGMNTSIAGLESNLAFGAYSPAPAWVLSAEQVDEQPAALKVTWAAPGAGTVGQWVNVRGVPVKLGVPYTASVKVFVPSGSPDVFLDAVFQNRGATLTVKDQWVQISTTFVPDNTQVFVGVGTASPVAGGVVFVEEWLLEEGSTVGDWYPGETLAHQYAVRIVARDDDGSAPASNVTAGSATQAQQYEISAEYAYFGEVYMNQLRSGRMEADAVIAGRWATAESGERMEMNPRGVEAYDSNENILTRINTDGTLDATGRARLETATVDGQLSVRELLELTRGARGVLSTGVTAPTQAPTVNSVLNTLPISYTAGEIGFTGSTKSIRFVTIGGVRYCFIAIASTIEGTGLGQTVHQLYRFVVDQGGVEPGALVEGTVVTSTAQPPLAIYLGGWPLVADGELTGFLNLRWFKGSVGFQADVHDTTGALVATYPVAPLYDADDLSRSPVAFCNGSSLWIAWKNTSNQVAMRRYAASTSAGSNLMPLFSSTRTITGGQAYPNNSTPYGGNVWASLTTIGDPDGRGVILGWYSNTGDNKDDPVGVFHNTYMSVDPTKTYEVTYDFKSYGSSIKIVGPYVEVFMYNSANALLGSTRIATNWATGQTVHNSFTITPGAHYSTATKIRIGFAANMRAFANRAEWFNLDIRQMGAWTNHVVHTVSSALGSDNIPLALCITNGLNDLTGVNENVTLIRTSSKVYALQHTTTGAPLGGTLDAYAWPVVGGTGKALDWSPTAGKYVSSLTDTNLTTLLQFNTHAANGPAITNTWYFQHTWFHTGNGYETAGSPWSAKHIASRRSWFSVATGAPLRLGTAADPDQIRVYSATSPTRTAGHLMGTSIQELAAAFRRVLEVNPATSGPASPDPAALPSPFPDSTPASWGSEVTDANGPLAGFDGAGGWRFGTLASGAGGRPVDLRGESITSNSGGNRQAGYVYVGNILIQWGSINLPGQGSGWAGTIAFTKPFGSLPALTFGSNTNSTAAAGVNTLAAGDGLSEVGSYGLSATGFNWIQRWVNSGTGEIEEHTGTLGSVSWIAIGPAPV